MRNRILLALLAFSPLAALFSLAAFAFRFNTPLGILVGDLTIVVPLMVLAFSKSAGFSSRSRRTLQIALACFLLLVPALAMHFAPQYSSKLGRDDLSRIYLDPPPHKMPAQGASILRGLSVDYGVMILRCDPGERSVYRAIVWNQDEPPPFHFQDQHQNGLDFRLNGDGLLHFEDDRGGFADVRWDGRQFLLSGSHSAGQSASVRSSWGSVVAARSMGSFLLILTPMLAWLIITLFALLRSHETDAPSASLIFAGLLQIMGMALLTFALAAAPASFDEVSGGIMVMLVLLVLVCSGAGLAILAWRLLRIDPQPTGATP